MTRAETVAMAAVMLAFYAGWAYRGYQERQIERRAEIRRYLERRSASRPLHHQEARHEP